MPIDDAAEQIRHCDLLEGERAAAAFEAREVEQIADQLLELLRLFADDRQVARLRLLVEREVGHAERFGVAADRGQRRHQLVRDVGEELPAGAVGRP